MPGRAVSLRSVYARYHVPDTAKGTLNARVESA